MIYECSFAPTEQVASAAEPCSARRPVFPLAFRLRALAELESVSLAYPFSGDNPLSLLAKLQPDIHVKGGSFKEERVAQERQLLKSWNGELRLLPLVEGFSTTRLLEGIGKE